jgi:hypothetical protein
MKIPNSDRAVIESSSLSTAIVVASFLIYGQPTLAEQRACVVTDKGATVCGKLTTPKKEDKKQNLSSTYKKELKGFVVNLQGCNKLETKVTCNFSIKNKRQELRSLYMRPWLIRGYDALIVDMKGRSYTASEVDFGNNQNSIEMSPDVDYSLAITFKEMPEQLTKAQILKIDFENTGTIDFRNVPITTSSP